ncbi:MAG TPA: M23 family metallopeptidase [Anaerolineaceae bacterium]|nr:M23 family metallopeptidase [Anaerolineaceae bacterium]
MKKIVRFLLIGIGIVVVVVVMVFYETVFHPQRSSKVLQWLRAPEEHAEWSVQARTRCGEAPFMLPTSGLIGYLWDDSFRIGHHHQGIDIFGGTAAGITPVYAAYDGYLTRLSDWKSSVIMRIPDDPLQPGRQIWTYYTHMADKNGESYIVADFPPGTEEVFVKAGTLLGYQGNYSGSANNPTGVHLHFSIVLSGADGNFKNELKIENTIDPSPYFGLPLNGKENKGEVPVCSSNP